MEMSEEIESSRAGHSRRYAITGMIFAGKGGKKP
jgi:hypothetical protein